MPRTLILVGWIPWARVGPQSSKDSKGRNASLRFITVFGGAWNQAIDYGMAPVRGSSRCSCPAWIRGFGPILLVLGCLDAKTATRLNSLSPELMSVWGTPAGTLATYGA